MTLKISCLKLKYEVKNKHFSKLKWNFRDSYSLTIQLNKCRFESVFMSKQFKNTSHGKMGPKNSKNDLGIINSPGKEIYQTSKSRFSTHNSTPLK